ncbi:MULTISPECIES: Crp/Fnr family transcriptional regulator [Helicobacter]|uniref:Crp/Fnr family transcriptional regulator n=1 Tax=Helicobacter TaxID=209 RepID=UPI002617ABF4|nr:cyclic nucleotide-binding domain-containing protein [Helicobacter sp. UBA3407]
MPTFNTLESYAPFNALAKEDLMLLSQITTFKHFVAKEMVLYEQTRVSSLFFLCKGCLKLYKVGRFDNEVFLGLLENGLLLDFNSQNTKGEFFSFANLECVEDSLIACFDGIKLTQILEQNPRILALFFKETQKKSHFLRG